MSEECRFAEGDKSGLFCATHRLHGLGGDPAVCHFAADALRAKVAEAEHQLVMVREGKSVVESRLASLEAQHAALHQALNNLVTRLHFVHGSEEYKAVWYLYATHTVGGYRGPSYEAVLKEADAALAPRAGEEEQS
jgi:hypothetical protein